MGSRVVEMTKSPNVRALLVTLAFGASYYAYLLTVHAVYGHTRNFPPHLFIKTGALVALVLVYSRIYRDRIVRPKAN